MEVAVPYYPLMMWLPKQSARVSIGTTQLLSWNGLILGKLYLVSNIATQSCGVTVNTPVSKTGSLLRAQIRVRIPTGLPSRTGEVYEMS